jgi:hypothetical protein
MKFENTTIIPDSFLRAVVRWSKPPIVNRLRKVTVHNTSSGGIHGRGGSWEIYIAIPERVARISYPQKLAYHGAYLGNVVYTLEEYLIDIIAHEMRHCWQTVMPRGRRVWGAKGQYSERDADAYALKMVRKYRRGEFFCGDDKYWNSQRIVLPRRAA